MEGTTFREIKTICVFSGSKLGADIAYKRVADTLGRLLAARRINLVYGGGSSGLMGCVASCAYIGGSQVLGIIPEALTANNLAGFPIGDEVRVSSMQERITSMLHKADAFIALPGGLGTLEEIFTITSWAQLNIHQKPIGLLNINNFYDGLLSFLEHTFQQGFISPFARRILISAPTPENLINQLLRFVPVPEPFMKRVEWKAKGQKKKQKREEGPDLTLRL